VPDEIDEQIQRGLDNTTESWKLGLLHAARDERNTRKREEDRSRLSLWLSVATFLVVVATLIVAILK
jgi:uncharacterized membrane protein YidH (DUF202 family)